MLATDVDGSGFPVEMFGVAACCIAAEMRHLLTLLGLPVVNLHDCKVRYNLATIAVDSAVSSGVGGDTRSKRNHAAEDVQVIPLIHTALTQEPFDKLRGCLGSNVLVHDWKENDTMNRYSSVQMDCWLKYSLVLH